MSDSNIQPTPPNRLTIGFLMLWTFGTAIILARYRAVHDSPPQTALERAISLHSLCSSLVNGLAIAGVIVFVQRNYCRVGGFPTQPGHWLLLVRGFSSLAWLVGWIGLAAAQSLVSAGQFKSLFYLSIQWVPMAAVSCAGYTIALSRDRVIGRSWRLAMRLLQIDAVLGLAVTIVVLAIGPSGTWMVPYVCTTWFYPVVFVLLVVALATDKDWKTRDFLHWAGVASAIVSLVLPFIFQLLVWLLNQ